VNGALLVSIQSAIWTIVASTAAVGLGLRSHTAVLVAFGAIGFVDAVGSMALVYHFRHALRHDRMSDRLEKRAHRIVLVGLLMVGSAAIVGGLTRLAMGRSSEASNAGVALAAASFIVLTVLSARKRSIARLVSSNALRSDGHLSAIGAMQAAVTLAGTAATRWVGWRWADAAATTVVGCVAATLAVATWSVDARQRRTSTLG
jgi:divalent metal cation (Fe/Co/Zn/Cd) transporter